MNKKILKYIEKELRKESELTILFKPTIQECDYLYSKGITSTLVSETFKGLYYDDIDDKFTTNFTKFAKEM